MLSVLIFQNAGEGSVANLDRLRYADGATTTADLRLRMQKVCVLLIYLVL